MAALSLWALVSGHWSAWQAARVEVKQEKEEEKEDEKQEDLPGEIAERVVELLQAQHVSTFVLQLTRDRPARRGVTADRCTVRS